MSKNDRQRVRSDSALMDEVNIEPVDLGRELSRSVQFGLLCAPVETVPPVGYERLQISQLGALFPARARHLVGPANMIQSLTEIVERLFRDLNMKSFNCHFVSFLSPWTLFSLCPKVRLTLPTRHERRLARIGRSRGMR